MPGPSTRRLEAAAPTRSPLPRASARIPGRDPRRDDAREHRVARAGGIDLAARRDRGVAAPAAQPSVLEAQEEPSTRPGREEHLAPRGEPGPEPPEVEVAREVLPAHGHDVRPREERRRLRREARSPAHRRRGAAGRPARRPRRTRRVAGRRPTRPGSPRRPVRASRRRHPARSRGPRRPGSDRSASRRSALARSGAPR